MQVQTDDWVHVQVSTGAQNDLEKITQMAYSTVAVYGMNERVGLVSFPPDKQRLDKPYSDDTARLIDQEVRAVVASCYDKTLELLREKHDAVEALAQVCLSWPCLLAWLQSIYCELSPCCVVKSIAGMARCG